ncbi:2-oxoglutarate and iron-dependent oxygenase domain-containing protein CP2-like isoform X2 [Phaseolus vulgaris]|uniref:2-oxoglutarate and iron-dependent oxygenase domain-containing protein CP2-like isoform X2 n=1 Tax=Phaseolus vulgaris TaxID=3885 RepID=UPI0035C9E973
MSQSQHSAPQQSRPSDGHVTARVMNLNSDKLCVSPNRDHNSENYEDLQLEFNPHVFGSLEQYLPPHILNLSREVKVRYMRNILLRYFPENDRNRPLHREIYTMDAENFFRPSFLRAIKENTEASFRSIMAEPSAGIYTFEMLQPQFCKKLMSEVDNFERWVRGTKLRIMRPNAMSKHGVVLEDFGLETMLDKFMSDFIHPISRVFYSEFGGSSLDSHHGFVVEYGISKDVELGLHVDDAEVSLNICLGKEFSGGEVFFQGVRCEEHVLSNAQPGEIFNYSHVPGHAVLHPGRQRHGARSTTSGNRMNLIIWCRSSAFRELKKYQRDFPSWCGECKRKKKERERLSLMVTQQELLKREI